MSRVIVFDLDGTLAETAIYWLPILKAFQEEAFRLHNISTTLPPEGALKLLGTSDRYLLGVMYPGLDEEMYGQLQKLTKDVWSNMLDQHPFRFYDGVMETLAELRSDGWKIFLSSNCDMFYMRNMCEAGLGKFLESFACAEMYPRMEKWQFTQDMLIPYKSKGDWKGGWFVGDSVHDMRAGRGSGLQTIYAEYGYASCEDESMIDIRIRSVREVPDIVRGTCL